MEVAGAAGKVARVLAGLVFGLVLLLVGAYGVVLFVNRHDEAPSADARRLEALIDARPAVAAADNAYVYLLGMTAIDGEDPLALGRQRQAYVEDYPAPGHRAEVAPWPGRDRAPLQAPAGPQDAMTCRQDGAACLALLGRDPAAVDARLSAAPVELERYDALIGRSGWRESIPSGTMAPLPSWKPAMDGQRLWLLSAWQHARAGDTGVAISKLQRDLLFWRKVLRESDLLLTKMIAAAAIRTHFLMGNLVLRELQHAGVAAPVPPAWLEPISLEERSLLRAVAGEWRFSRAALAEYKEYLANEAENPAKQASSFEEVMTRLNRPLLQSQASLNGSAALLVRIADSSQAPYPQLRTAVETASRPTSVPWHAQLYNPTGRVLLSIAGPAYMNYAVRIADLEGLRRLALLAAQLRDRPPGTLTPAQTAGEVASAPLRDPLSEQAFVWNSTDQVLEYMPSGRSASEPPYRMPL